MNILIIEDEKPLARLIAAALERNNFRSELLHSGEEAVEKITKNAYDAVVLDLTLPGMDGIDILKGVRGAEVPTPILVMTARGAITDRVSGLYSGADDYMAKPCDLDELVARVYALVRRSGSRAGVLKIGGVTIDPLSRGAVRGERRMDLTDREFVLLEVLMRSAGMPLTRTQITERVFGFRFDPDTNLVDVHVKNLRQKLEVGDEKALVHTVHKIGYVFNSEW